MSGYENMLMLFQSSRIRSKSLARRKQALQGGPANGGLSCTSYIGTLYIFLMKEAGSIKIKQDVLFKLR